MIERRGGLRLPLETLAGSRVVVVGVGEELQRDITAQACVLGLVDDAHAPASQFLEDAVMGDGLANHWMKPSIAVPVLASAFMSAQGSPGAGPRGYQGSGAGREVTPRVTRREF